MAGTQYDYRARAQCSGGWGAWSAIDNFTTLACGTPDNVTADNVTSTTITFGWDAVPEAIRYKFFYREIGGSWTTFNAAGNSFTLIGLSPNTTYKFGVKTVCDYGITPPSSIGTVTTSAAGGCDVPTNQLASGITSNSATVSWDAMPDAIKYKISYRESTSSMWTTLNVFTNSKTLTGLAANTNYLYVLRTHCPAGLTLSLIHI